MWSALKTDLLDFVSTIQQDTSKTLSKVLGDEEVDVEAEEENLLAKWAASTKRSYETYANPLRENKVKEFERFKRRFSLTSHAAEIAGVLDEEPEVSRFYAELVPLSLSPDEFWARKELFFRLHLLARSGKINFEEEDEEEQLVWEEDENAQTDASPETSSRQAVTALEQQLAGMTRSLEAKDAENASLRQQVAYLTQKVAQLELQLRSEQPSSPVPAPAAPPSAQNPDSASVASSDDSQGSSALLVNHSDANSSAAYFTDDETSRHGTSLLVQRPLSLPPQSPTEAVPQMTNSTRILASTLGDEDEDEEESGWT